MLSFFNVSLKFKCKTNFEQSGISEIEFSNEFWRFEKQTEFTKKKESTAGLNGTAATRKNRNFESQRLDT